MGEGVCGERLGVMAALASVIVEEACRVSDGRLRGVAPASPLSTGVCGPSAFFTPSAMMATPMPSEAREKNENSETPASATRPSTTPCRDARDGVNRREEEGVREAET